MNATPLDLEAVDFAKGDGFVTVVTQDAATGEVLMVAHADRAALERTLASGEMHYRSRTRGAWHKGATSGNVQRVVSLALDCDADAVLARVTPLGPACHTGGRTCFGDGLPAADVFSRLDATIEVRAAGLSSDGVSYTRTLLADRNLRLKKLGEESAELVLAAADGDRERAVAEAGDLVYHVLVTLRALNAGIADVRRELEKRERSTT